MGLLCLGLFGNGQAGRPMATDDTVTVSLGEFQNRGVGPARRHAEHAQIAAPACGLSDTLELDTAASRSQGSAAKVTGLGLGLKWAPDAAVYDTAWGRLSLGVEAGAALPSAGCCSSKGLPAPTMGARSSIRGFAGVPCLAAWGSTWWSHVRAPAACR